MPLRTEIEKALAELISDAEGMMKFQGLAVVLTKLKWPEFIACERKKDLGLDAYVPASLAGVVFGRTVHRFSVFSLEGGLDGLPLRMSNEFTYASSTLARCLSGDGV